ncbi:MAG TPA: pectin acetylesterase-family hydrolase [Ilumatobacteraceae bacterium]|nr:pectin acetylesterase-family hydrolase [Ilumatobacteraceae bacterium]
MKRAAAIALALLGVVAACSDSSSSSPTSPAAVTSAPAIEVSTTAAPPTSDATTTLSPTTVATTTTTVPIAAWQQVTAPSQCMCADGSPYSYWVHQGDPTKVVFFLQGGGACFDATTCAFDSNTYRVKLGAADDPNTFTSGVFDFTDPRNPLGDYSFVFAPYCTGDVHLGTATHVYGPQLTVQHKGSFNATAALDDLATHFPNATQIVVAGESAGSAPTPLYAGLAHDLLPNADITVLADGSGAYPDVPAVNGLIGQLWGVADAIPLWPENSGLTAADFSLPGLLVQANKHDPDIIFGRHDYAFDAVQKLFAGLAGFPADDLVSLIDANETEIEKGGVDLHSYISPGQSHTVLSKPEFYTETVEGVPLVDWVSDLIRRQPDLDVHCTDCT